MNKLLAFTGPIALIAALLLPATARVNRHFVDIQKAPNTQFAPIFAQTIEVAGIPKPSDMVRIGPDNGIVGQSESYTVPQGHRLVITGAGNSSQDTIVQVERDQGSGFSVVWTFTLRSQDSVGFVENPSIVNNLGTPSCLYFEAGDIIRASSTVGNPVLVGYISKL